jgi:hypothetical protein
VFCLENAVINDGGKQFNLLLNMRVLYGERWHVWAECEYHEGKICELICLCYMKSVQLFNGYIAKIKTIS